MQADETTELSRAVLDPIDRISEVLSGLIMVLTFTCSISVGHAGREQIDSMLVGAIGCNLAWGLMDAVMYLMSNLTEHARGLATLKAVRTASQSQEADRMIAQALPSVVASVLRPEVLEEIRIQLKDMPEPPQNASPNRQDWFGTIAVFFLVFLSTFPVVLPFLFMKDSLQALRVSNGIAIVMLFLAGYSLGKFAGVRHPWWTGLKMVAVGVVLVAVTIALGG